MDNSYILELIIGGLAAMATLFGKMQLDSLQARIKKLEEDDEYIKEYYFKKEDFKDFKQELWQRLDKMETAMEAKIDRIRGYKLTDFPERG